MQTTVPNQHSNGNSLIKKFLHTKAGAFIGFKLGISGYNHLELTQIRNGKIVGKSNSYNSRVDVGAALAASLISGTTLGGISSPLPAKYIALSTSSLTPAKGDTTLSGETVVSGLARALGTSASYTAPVSLDGAASYVLSKTFTAGGSATLQSAAIFDASSSGNMFVEANLSSSVAMVNGDLLAVNWTVNL